MRKRAPTYRCWHKIEKRLFEIRNIDFENETVGLAGWGGNLESWEKVVFLESTGLCDKTGTPIYEGDFVRILPGQEIRSVVFSPVCAGFVMGDARCAIGDAKHGLSIPLVSDTAGGWATGKNSDILVVSQYRGGT